MPTDIRTKDDVEFHLLGNGYRVVPAVNVKVHFWMPRALESFREYEPDANPHFTEEWIEERITDEKMNDLFWLICEWGWEDLQALAEEVWGSHVRVYSEGRCSGWAYVQGIDNDVESWDAVDLARWRKFAKGARLEADDIPYRIVSSIYLNEFEEWNNQ